eukprot:CAMPEP_0181219336 /NCGR_PEP_ID=MMETSP1096-20121128/28206_1 /TAXON_ID=156174 ORGANISM="Chrysochromulina ericina, Strain CCMP281" /NCGR_SAMPLE_ID=MMETSP1096 /ASSEMBLY_ACC=CAM_ASM_000453 /LENGTH=84 /DNA_ID=CAMNT_0023311679 /DNA_START=172 /DNA_END=423 /DNA_ORIENTATION=+
MTTLQKALASTEGANVQASHAGSAPLSGADTHLTVAVLYPTRDSAGEVESQPANNRGGSISSWLAIAAPRGSVKCHAVCQRKKE